MEDQIPTPPTYSMCFNGGIVVEARLPNQTRVYQCFCLDGFAGDYCETVLTGGPTLPGQQYPLLYNICLCLFLFILLPTIILYSIRTIYLALKRCNKSDDSIIEEEVRRASEVPRSRRISSMNRLQVHFVQPVDTATSGNGAPRPAYRTFSLPLSATVVLAHPLNADEVRRLHKTTSWHHGVALPPPPPPPSYAASVSDFER
uniref:EGF-like domain-containing protein n=1 Tax=Panagrellus redivivus TaxID=6233 RepID=A0A7E4UZP6_PANRE